MKKHSVLPLVGCLAMISCRQKPPQVESSSPPEGGPSPTQEGRTPPLQASSKARKQTTGEKVDSFWVTLFVEEENRTRYAKVAISKPAGSAPIPAAQVKLELFNQKGQTCRLKPVDQREFLVEVGGPSITACAIFVVQDEAIENLSEARVEIFGKQLRLGLHDY